MGSGLLRLGAVLTLGMVPMTWGGSTLAQSTERLTIAEIAQRNLASVVSIVVRDQRGNVYETGSGFVLAIADPGALFVTNLHVIAGGFSASIETADNQVIDEPLVLGTNREHDIAILATRRGLFTASRLGDSETVQIGDHVVAIGNPQGLTGTVSDGIVSAKRQISAGAASLQITAPISPGSSGGPLFNDAGEVIGVTTATVQGGQNLNLAVPIGYVKRMVDLLNGAKPISLAQLNQGAYESEASGAGADIVRSIRANVGAIAGALIDDIENCRSTGRACSTSFPRFFGKQIALEADGRMVPNPLTAIGSKGKNASNDSDRYSLKLVNGLSESVYVDLFQRRIVDTSAAKRFNRRRSIRFGWTPASIRSYSRQLRGKSGLSAT